MNHVHITQIESFVISSTNKGAFAVKISKIDQNEEDIERSSSFNIESSHLIFTMNDNRDCKV